MSGALSAIFLSGVVGIPVSGDITSGTTSFGSNGTLTGSNYSGPSAWIAPQVSGIGANYWVRVQNISGTASTTMVFAGFTILDGAFSSLFQLSSSRSLIAGGNPGSRSGIWQIFRDAGGLMRVANGVISVNNTL